MHERGFARILVANEDERKHLEAHAGAHREKVRAHSSIQYTRCVCARVCVCVARGAAGNVSTKEPDTPHAANAVGPTGLRLE